MEPFQFGFLEAIFKVIEERILFGRAITTIASFLLIAAVIVFCASYLFSAATSVVAGIHFSTGFPSLPNSRDLIAGFVAAALAGIWLLSKILQARDEQLEKRAQIARENEILDRLKQLTQPKGNDN